MLLSARASDSEVPRNARKKIKILRATLYPGQTACTFLINESVGVVILMKYSPYTFYDNLTFNQFSFIFFGFVKFYTHCSLHCSPLSLFTNVSMHFSET